MTNEQIIKQIYDPYADKTSALKFDELPDDDAITLMKVLDAAREDEAIRFAEWYDKIFIKTGTIRDLYLKYKKQNP